MRCCGEKYNCFRNGEQIGWIEQSLPNLGYNNQNYVYVIIDWWVLRHAEYIINVNILKVSIIVLKPITHYEDLNTVRVHQYGNMLFLLRLF